MLFPPPNRPSHPARVVITGAGVVTALGTGWRANADGFRAGRTAFRPVSIFDVSRQRAQQAAEVELPAELPPTRLAAKRARRLDRAGGMLLLAAHEAWQQSGWEPSEDLPLVLGTTSGGMLLGEDYFRQAVRHPRQHRRQPTRAMHYQSHRHGQMLEEAFGFHGPVTIIANACASGASALGHAWELLRRGHTGRVLAGGYDALSQMVFSGFDSLQAMTRTVCRPFDAHRDGLALGEGAAVMALETLDCARRRNAEILGEIVGYGASIDLHHLTQPHPQGDAALAAMQQACATAQVAPEAIDYLNAHGTGTPLNDGSEAVAIQRWAGPRARSLPVSSTKAGIGHLLGGAGAVEAAICLMALREQWLPPEMTLETPDPVCCFPIVREPAEAKVALAMSNSFGFGGVNATLILRRWP